MLLSGGERGPGSFSGIFTVFGIPGNADSFHSGRISASPEGSEPYEEVLPPSFRLSLDKVCAHDRQERGRPFRALSVLSVSIVLKRGELFPLEEIGLPFTAKYHKIDRILYNRFCFFI